MSPEVSCPLIYDLIRLIIDIILVVIYSNSLFLPIILLNLFTTWWGIITKSMLESFSISLTIFFKDSRKDHETEFCEDMQNLC